jgi:phosphopentomutase
MDAMENSWKNIEKVLCSLPEDYAVIITADHGGHGRTHGTDLPEDMTIPMLLLGNGIDTSINLSDASIKDVAPTIVKLLGIEPDEEWEGISLV